MALDLVQNPHWMMSLLSGFVIPLMLASATLMMFWLDERR